MALKLLTVEAGQGVVWVRRGFTEFFRRPLGYLSLFLTFMVTALFVSVFPYIGSVLLIMAMPLLTLGFMMGTRESMLGKPVLPSIYLVPWRGDLRRRRSLLALMGLYALATLGMLLLCNLIDGGSFDALVSAVAQGDGSPDALQALADAPGVLAGAIARVVLTVLLSVPFWHAPALMQWSGQGLAQALFSSALALWRARAAYLVFVATWVLALSLIGAVCSLVFTLLGEVPTASLLFFVGLITSCSFYITLYFGFVDCFGEPA
jgi:hypothetical protein